jgi:CheY-like chemotaxis protein
MTTEHHRRVLVVDDDPDVRTMVVTALRQRFLHVDEAADGRQAINLLGQNRYAVILLDLLMPDVDGFTVIEAIDQKAYPPIILVVTGADRRVVDRLDPRRAHGIVKKPFDPYEVADVVSACADIRGLDPVETQGLEWSGGLRPAE